MPTGLNIRGEYTCDEWVFNLEESKGQLDYSITTGYIEFVAVRKKYRKQGIASTMQHK